ncbi:sulfatase-like hydrolase/transferase [Lentisphaerota bacterium WC36G]|nr:sulfatase-like hydrolase/transferase [Lentisphaerae bacterium WC36]
MPNKRFIKNYQNSTKSKQAKNFASMIESMDKSLGDLITECQNLKIADNTLIIFLGDNGSDAPFGPIYGYNSSSPSRGKKELITREEYECHLLLLGHRKIIIIMNYLTLKVTLMKEITLLQPIQGC